MPQMTHFEKVSFCSGGNPAGIYLLNINNRNTKTMPEICSKLIIKTPERRHRFRSVFFIVNFEHISYLTLVFLYFEHIIVYVVLLWRIKLKHFKKLLTIK